MLPQSDQYAFKKHAPFLCQLKNRNNAKMITFATFKKAELQFAVVPSNTVI